MKLRSEASSEKFMCLVLKNREREVFTLSLRHEGSTPNAPHPSQGVGI